MFTWGGEFQKRTAPEARQPAWRHQEVPPEKAPTVTLLVPKNACMFVLKLLPTQRDFQDHVDEANNETSLEPKHPHSL